MTESIFKSDNIDPLTSLPEHKMMVWCCNCSECIGEHKMYYASEHLKKFPNHHSYFVAKFRQLPRFIQSITRINKQPINRDVKS